LGHSFTNEDHFFYHELRENLFLYTRDPIQGGGLIQTLDNEIDTCDGFIAIICADYGRGANGSFDKNNPCTHELERAVRKWSTRTDPHSPA
jgi:hypothetical protein